MEDSADTLAPIPWAFFLLLVPFAGAVAALLAMDSYAFYEEREFLNASYCVLGGTLGALQLLAFLDWRLLRTSHGEEEALLTWRPEQKWMLLICLAPVGYPLYFHARRKLGGANLVVPAIAAELVFITAFWFRWAAFFSQRG